MDSDNPEERMNDFEKDIYILVLKNVLADQAEAIEKLRIELSNKAAECESRISSFNQLLADYNLLEQENLENETKCIALSWRPLDLEADLREVRRALDFEVNLREIRNRRSLESDRELSDLREQVRRFKNYNLSLQSTISEKISDFSIKIEETAKQFEANLDRLQKRIKKSIKEVSKCKNLLIQKHDLEKKILKANAEIQRLEGDNKVLKNNVSSLFKSKEALKNSVSDLKAQNKSLLTQKANLETEKAELEKIANEQNDMNTSEIASLKREKKNLNLEVDQLKREALYARNMAVVAAAGLFVLLASLIRSWYGNAL